MFLFSERTLVREFVGSLLAIPYISDSETCWVWRFCLAHSSAFPNPAFLFLLMQFSNHYSEFIGKGNSFRLSEISQPMGLWWCISHTGEIFRIGFSQRYTERWLSPASHETFFLSVVSFLPSGLERALFTSIIQLRPVTLFMLDSFNHHLLIHCLYCTGNHWEMTLLDWDTGCHHHFSCAQWTQQT